MKNVLLLLFGLFCFFNAVGQTIECISITSINGKVTIPYERIRTVRTLGTGSNILLMAGTSITSEENIDDIYAQGCGQLVKVEQSDIPLLVSMRNIESATKIGTGAGVSIKTVGSSTLIKTSSSYASFQSEIAACSVGGGGGGTDTNWSNSDNTADDDHSQNGDGHNLLLDNYNDLGFVSNSLLQTTSGQIYLYAGSNLTLQSAGYTAFESAGLTQIGADSIVINGEAGSVSKLKLNNNLGASYMIQPPTTGSGSHVLVLPPEDGTVGQAVGISSISSNVVQLGYLTAGSSVTTTREDGVITSTSSTTWNPLTANTERMLDATVNNGFTYTVNLGQAINCQNCEISFSNFNAGITGTGNMVVDGYLSELVGSGGSFTIGAGLGATFKSVNTSGATWEWRRKF